MFNLTQENPIFLEEAAGLVRTHFSTVFRWIFKGAKAPNGERIRLEACKLGSRWCTSREALNRFAERLTPRLEDGPPMSSVRTETQRTRASEKAAKQLEAAGI
jgi:hypothetical protein